ncbi:MAG TPA: TonB-dependent receptor [Gemmatimonadaceae bacterium]|nr:TonB-dependent receptor [Gemmatimonadaceae bacterium]
MTFRFLTLGVLALIPRITDAQEKQDSATAPRPLAAVVISATRSEQTVENLPSPVKVIGTPEIKASAATSVPDLLRSIPGFTLRDAQSGLISNPARGIVTFRGLGGSSAGRVLVLLDGVPFGDPFSGWIDWGRMPISMLGSAEVIRGGGAVIWGSRALGGVVNLRTIDPRLDEVRFTAERGSFNTSHGAGVASLKRAKLSAVLAADYLDTDNFNVVPASQAGPIDAPDPVRNGLVTGKLNYDITPSVQGWVSGSTYRNGQPPWGTLDDLQFNDARTGIRWLTQSHGIVTATGFAVNRLNRLKTFSINTDRTTSTPSRYQNSPANSQGLFAQWTQMLRYRHEISSGVDYTSIRGSLTDAYTFVNNAPTESRRVAGDQQFLGAFVQDAADLGHSLRMVASIRFDRVNAFDADRTVTSLKSGAVLNDSTIAGHIDSRVTWSLGFRRQQASWLALRVNGYQAFRAPSMYEMYYPRFSSRGTVTEANAQLEAERLSGLEGGFDLEIGPEVLARFTAFTNRVASPILDITIGTAGNTAQVIAPCGLMPAKQTCLQRQNVRALRSNGIESDFVWRPSAYWRFNAGYSYNSTRVKAPGQPVDGMRALRSAPNASMAGVSFDNPRWFSASIEARHVGPRFDDDLNTIELAPFDLVGFRLNRDVGRRVTARLKVENLFDEEFQVTRTRAGLAELGAPRWVTFGLETRW